MLKINELNNSKVENGKNAVTYKRVTKNSRYFEKQKEIFSINNEFTLTPNHTQVIWQKQYQRLIQIAYYQAGKTVIQTLLPQHPPVSLIMLNPLGVTASTSADTYISSDPTSNTQCCSSLESRLIGFYGGKATAQLFEYEYERMSFFSHNKENPFVGTFKKGTILPHMPALQAISASIPKVAVLPTVLPSLMLKSTCGMGKKTGKTFSNTNRKTVYGNGSNSEKRVKMVHQLDKSTLLGYFQKRSLALWKKRTHLVACSPQSFSSTGKESKTSFFQNKKTTNFPNLSNEFQNLITKLKNKRDLYNFSTTLVRVLSADAKTSFEKDTPNRITSLGEHVITPPRTLCTTEEEQVPQKFQKTNTEWSRSFAGAGNNFFQSNIGTIEIQTATRLANLLVNTWNFYSFNPKLVGEIEDAQYAKLFEQKEGNKVFPKSSYSSKRISIENVKTKQSSNVERVNLINSFQFSNIQRDSFSLGWFRLYLPDIEATTFLKNAANYFFNLGLQRVVRPSIRKLTPKLCSSACDFKFACVDQLESKRFNIFSNTKTLLHFSTRKLNKNNSSQIIPILPLNSKVKTAPFTWQKTKGNIPKYSQNMFSCLGKTTNNLRIGLGLLRSMAKRRNQTYHRPGLMNKNNIPHRIGLIGDKVDKINIKHEQFAYLDVSSFLSLEKQIILKGSTNETTFDHNLETSFQYYYSTLPPKPNKSVGFKGSKMVHIQQFSNPQAYLLVVRSVSSFLHTLPAKVVCEVLPTPLPKAPYASQHLMHTLPPYHRRWYVLLPSVCIRYAHVLLHTTFGALGSGVCKEDDTFSALENGVCISTATVGGIRSLSSLMVRKTRDTIKDDKKQYSTAKGNKQKMSGVSPNHVNVNKVFNVEKELISRALINNSFTKAFLLINQNRQLLDYFVDYLIRFQILRQHQILYLFSAILLNCKKSK